MNNYNINNFGGWSLDLELFEWVLKNIPKGSTILELGSGKSTAEFCKHYTVYSVEHNTKWINKSPSNYIYAPIKEYSGYKWYDRDVLEKELPSEYNLLIVDGPPGSIGRRGMLHNIDLFDTKTLMLIDDTSRREEKEIAEILKEKFGKEEIFSYFKRNKAGIVLK
jgi:hypothetical protein